MTHTNSLRAASAVLLAILAVPAASAQEAHGATLPKAGALFERHIEATGGAEARRAILTRKRTGKLEVDMAGHVFGAKVVEHSKAPGSNHVLLDGSAFSQVSVTNGKEAWEWRPDARDHGDRDTGATDTHLLSGDPKVRALSKARLHAALEWRETYTSVETVRETEVSGKPAYEVRALRKGGGEFWLSFDKHSGRLVKRASTQTLDQMGTTKMEVHLEDYAQTGGVWEPMTVRVQLDSDQFGEGVQLWTYSKVEVNPKIAASLFELPAELKHADHAEHTGSGQHE